MAERPEDLHPSITLQEGAKLYGCGLTKFKAMVQVGAIPHMHNGRRVLLRPEDVIAYRDKQIETHMVTHQPRVLMNSRRHLSFQGPVVQRGNRTADKAQAQAGRR